MRYNISFDNLIHALIVKTSGTMKKDDFIEMAENLLQHPEFSSGENVIFDHIDLDFSHVSVETLEAIRFFHTQNEEQIGGGKSAIVVKPGFSGKWNRLWEKGQKINTANRVMVFEDFDEAAQWIK
jgi:hypothetical protein